MRAHVISQHILRIILTCGLFIPFLSGCAVNPATKEMEFMTVSEEREFRIGQQVAKQVREETGIYLELPALRSLVKRVGERLGRNSDRPNLIYRIEIADSPDFNAFALPGGFVFVNRGLLERMNSVDELASVLGHEIAHVAARHSAAMISKAELMNIGLMGLAVATKGSSQYYGSLINVGAALAFNKFSRDDEREADHYGTIYMTRAGYNPGASIEVMNQIERLQTKKPSSLDTWFMTHPPTSERLANLNREMEEIRYGYPGVLRRPVRRNQYVALLDGLAVGEWNGNELIKGNRYYNKEYLLSFRIPEGWFARINSKKYTAILAQPKKEFYALFDIEPLRVRKTTAEYYTDFERRVENLGLRRVYGLRGGRVLGHGALSGIYESSFERRGHILAEGIAFVRGANGYSFLGYSKKTNFKGFQPLLESMAKSLKFISQREGSKLSPPRLRVHRVVRGETWASITGKYLGSPRGMEKLVQYNGFEASQEPTPGTLIKIPPSLRFR